jgi:hypothetical protein
VLLFWGCVCCSAGGGGCVCPDIVGTAVSTIQWAENGITTNFDGVPRGRHQPGVMEGNPTFLPRPPQGVRELRLPTHRFGRYKATLGHDPYPTLPHARWSCDASESQLSRFTVPF